METLGALGFVVLLANAAAHLADVAAVARASTLRAVVGFFVPPLAALWAWEGGARRRAAAWAATLGAFVIIVVTITHLR